MDLFYLLTYGNTTRLDFINYIKLDLSMLTMVKRCLPHPHPHALGRMPRLRRNRNKTCRLLYQFGATLHDMLKTMTLQLLNLTYHREFSPNCHGGKYIHRLLTWDETKRQVGGQIPNYIKMPNPHLKTKKSAAVMIAAPGKTCPKVRRARRSRAEQDTEASASRTKAKKVTSKACGGSSDGGTNPHGSVGDALSPTSRKGRGPLGSSLAGGRTMSQCSQHSETRRTTSETPPAT